jgi:hypothetical protein
MDPIMRRWLIGVTLTASTLVVIGCGSAQESAAPSAQAVLGPWQAGPMTRLDDTLAHAAETQCRARTPEASGLPVVLHDQRGDGVDTVIFAGPDGRASCQVAGDGSGKVTWLAGSATTDPATTDPGSRDITIDGMGSSSGSQTGTVSDISGRTGTAIASLRILLDDGREIVATTSNGWFYAWWPGESIAISLIGDDVAGRQVASAIP